MKKPLIINLQLCAENQFTGFNDPNLQAQVLEFMNSGQNNPQGNVDNGGQVVTSTPSTTETPAEGTEGQQAPPEQQPTENPAAVTNPQEQLQTAAPTQEQLLAGKFKSVDDLVNSYSNLESFNTKTRQEMSELIKQNSALMQMVEQMKNNPVQPPQTLDNPTPTPEVDTETFMSNLYDQPQQTIDARAEAKAMEVFKRMMDEYVKPQIAPIQQKFEQEQRQADWNNKIREFAQATPDFNDHLPTMQEILASKPELADHPDGLEIVYMMSKGKNAQAPQPVQQPQLSAEDIPDELKNAIIQQHLKSVKANNDNAPVTINSNNAAMGGEKPFTPEKKPTSLDEAGEMWMKMMNGR